MVESRQQPSREWEKTTEFYAYPPRVRETRKMVTLQATTWDIRKWRPGSFSEKAQLTFDVPPGPYRLGLGIRDPWQDRPAIRFANELTVRDGWTLLSDIKVTD
jgi:hypothetical protein